MDREIEDRESTLRRTILGRDIYAWCKSNSPPCPALQLMRLRDISLYSRFFLCVCVCVCVCVAGLKDLSSFSHRSPTRRYRIIVVLCCAVIVSRLVCARARARVF